MRFLVITFAAIAIEAQCRSVTLSNAKDADRSTRVHRDTNQDALSSNRIETIVSQNFLNLTDEKTSVNIPEQLKKLIVLYYENFEKFTNFAFKISENKDNDKQEIQFLDQINSLVEQIIKKQSKIRNIYTKLDNNTDSILQAMDNKSTMRSINNAKDLIDTMKEIDIVYQDGEIIDEHIRIKRAAERYKKIASFATLEERTINILIQRQLIQIWKYLDTLCKKHHLTTTTLEVNSNDDITSVNQPNKVSII